MPRGSLDQSVLKMWDSYGDERARKAVLECAQGLLDRDFEVIAVPTVSEANREMAARIGRHDAVYYWEAATLEELGVLETLATRGNYVKSAMSMFREPSRSKRHRFSRGDVYVTTVAAVTRDGLLVKPSPEGLPLWQPGARPGTIIAVCGYNKIVDDLDEALRRARDICVPAMSRRLGLDLPCVKAETCVECDHPEALCAVNTILTWSPRRPEVVVVLIGEKLGH